jgi:hypothetical protein
MDEEGAGTLVRDATAKVFYGAQQGDAPDWLATSAGRAFQVKDFGERRRDW